MSERITEHIVIGRNGACYEGVQFDGRVTVKAGVKGTSFTGCRFTSLINEGEDTTVLNSAFAFREVGIESRGRGLFVKNCRFEGNGTAISVSGEDVEIREITATVGKSGVGISICHAVNALVALSTVYGAQRSLVMQDCFNSVAVRNSLISVHATGGKHLYICDNEMSDRLYAKGINYLLADGNTYPEDGANHAAVTENNKNTNGDTVTDVNARLEVGADEDLLPHIDRDLFVGMARKQHVKECGADKPRSLYEYITEAGKGVPCVIVAPGAYAVEMTARFTAEHSGLTVYAYGVFAEGVEYAERSYNSPHILATDVSGLSVKGLSIGYAQQSNGQLHVLKKLGENKILAITSAGMRNEFSNTGSLFLRNTVDFGLQRGGSFACLGSYFMEAIEKNEDGTMTLTLRDTTYTAVQEGDVLTCRLGEYNHVVATKRSRNVIYKDFTQYGYAGGYAYFEDSNLDGVTYYRAADTYKGGFVLDQATYDRYRALEEKYDVSLELSIDEKGRYRGAPAHLSSLDATHCSFGGRGSTVISSILENMTDDGSNQNSAHARLSEVKDNGDGTLTLVYKGNMTLRLFGAYGENATFTRYCAPFKKGHRVYIYTAAGQLVCNTPVLSDGEPYKPVRSTFEKVKEQDIARFSLRVQASEVNLAALADFDLTDDDPHDGGKVLVDNLGAASYGFRFDNTVIRNGNVNGLRIKSSGGVVRNCTIENQAKSAVSIVLDLWWGESGVVEDFVFEKNVIGRTSYCHHRAPTIEDPSSEIKFAPITIMGLSGKVMDADHLLLKNMRIEGNKFTERCAELYDYAIYARAACNLFIRNNDFGDYAPDEGVGRTCYALYLDGSTDVEMSGNTYPAAIRGRASDYVHGTHYRHVYGTDVEQNGLSLIKDKSL